MDLKHFHFWVYYHFKRTLFYLCNKAKLNVITGALNHAVPMMMFASVS